MPDEQQVTWSELGPAMDAFAPVVEPARLERLHQRGAGFPVGALDRPRNHVLEAAEDRTAIALVPGISPGEPEAVPPRDLLAAPRTAEMFRSR